MSCTVFLICDLHSCLGLGLDSSSEMEAGQLFEMEAGQLFEMEAGQLI